eukprot:957092-Prorocentrum_minimum.AAC.1
MFCGSQYSQGEALEKVKVISPLPSPGGENMRNMFSMEDGMRPLTDSEMQAGPHFAPAPLQDDPWGSIHAPNVGLGGGAGGLGGERSFGAGSYNAEEEEAPLHPDEDEEKEVDPFMVGPRSHSRFKTYIFIYE